MLDNASLNPLLFLMAVIVYGMAAWMHLARKNVAVVGLYVMQSLALTGTLIVLALSEQSLPLLLVAIAALVLKVVVAPHVFGRIISRYKLIFLVSNYLSVPLTLLAIALLTFVVRDYFVPPLLILDRVGDSYSLMFLLSAMATSLLLVINRKGALSQILGVLSLENSIAAVAVFAGLEQLPAYQIGILLEFLLWVVIAATFLAMMYRHFGKLDSSSLSELQE